MATKAEQLRAATDFEAQVYRADQAAREAKAAADLAAWYGQTPEQWANHLAGAGIPKQAALILRDMFTAMQARIAVLEEKARANAKKK